MSGYLFRCSLDVIFRGRHIDWGYCYWCFELSQGQLNEIQWIAINTEESMVCFLLHTSLITAAICVYFAEKWLDTTAFAARWMVVVAM